MPISGRSSSSVGSSTRSARQSARAEDKELDLRPARDKIPAVDHFVQPPKPTGQDKPKY